MEELRLRAAEVDAFVVNTEYYRDFMSGYLRVPAEKIHVVPLGLDLREHGQGRGEAGAVHRIGYLARICPEKGTHNLVEAFIHLAEQVAARCSVLQFAGEAGAL